MNCNGFIYSKEKMRKNTTHWICLLYKNGKKACKARASTENSNPNIVRLTYKEHNHDVNAYSKCRLEKRVETADENNDSLVVEDFIEEEYPTEEIEHYENVEELATDES